MNWSIFSQKWTGWPFAWPPGEGLTKTVSSTSPTEISDLTGLPLPQSIVTKATTKSSLDSLEPKAHSSHCSHLYLPSPPPPSPATISSSAVLLGGQDSWTLKCAHNFSRVSLSHHQPKQQSRLWKKRLSANQILQLSRVSDLFCLDPKNASSAQGCRDKDYI